MIRFQGMALRAPAFPVVELAAVAAGHLAATSANKALVGHRSADHAKEPLQVQGIEHTVEVSAESVYEAVVQALRVFREHEWCEDDPCNNAMAVSSCALDSRK
jgi:hypothetical protein